MNTRSSTETELVTADMFMPEMLWSLHFMQAQGYEVECVGLYQDNISTQLLIKNGKYFFIKDRVDEGEIKVIDCPTEEMWADVMTKPLQGTTFRVMRAELMNCPVHYEDPTEGPDGSPIRGPKTVTWKATVFKTPQECVGQNRNNKVLNTTDRQAGRTKHPGRVAGRGVGVVRLRKSTWQVGAGKSKLAKQ
jgi:hypothetical protein